METRNNDINIIINIYWLPLRCQICRTYTLAYHLSLGRSTVRVSHQSSEGCAGSIPVCGSEILGRTYVELVP